MERALVQSYTINYDTNFYLINYHLYVNRENYIYKYDIKTGNVLYRYGISNKISSFYIDQTHDRFIINNDIVVNLPESEMKQHNDTTHMIDSTIPNVITVNRSRIPVYPFSLSLSNENHQDFIESLITKLADFSTARIYIKQNILRKITLNELPSMKFTELQITNDSKQHKQLYNVLNYITRTSNYNYNYYELFIEYNIKLKPEIMRYIIKPQFSFSNNTKLDKIVISNPIDSKSKTKSKTRHKSEPITQTQTYKIKDLPQKIMRTRIINEDGKFAINNIFKPRYKPNANKWAYKYFPIFDQEFGKNTILFGTEGYDNFDLLYDKFNSGIYKYLAFFIYNNHATILILDKFRKTYMYFDPLHNHDIKITHNMSLLYKQHRIYHNNKHTSVQSTESGIFNPPIKNNTAMCAMWVLLFLYYVVRNPDFTGMEINDHLLSLDYKLNIIINKFTSYMMQKVVI